jgi:uncharacterized protein (DUF302 family)
VIIMQDISYGYGKRLSTDDFEEAVRRVTAALQEQGFGILTEIDVKATIKKKLDRDFRRYKILGACNPPLAHQALEAEPQIGLLLPCNVVVQEDLGGGITVSIADPRAMMQFTGNEALVTVAMEADRRLRHVLRHLE